MKKKHTKEKNTQEEIDIEYLEEADDDDVDPDAPFEEIELEERGRRYARKKQKEKGRRKKTWKDYVTYAVLTAAVCVLVFSLYKLGTIFFEYQEGASEYKKLQEMVVKKKEPEPDQTAEEKTEQVTIDFAALQQTNKDTAAWIRFDEPSVINYPVVHCGDNETYLTKTFEANDNKLGALFIDAENQADFTDRNTIIYGHNMKNKTMFAELMEYQNKDYWSAHPYFTIYTPDGKETLYHIYAAGVVKDTAADYQVAFASDEEFQEYLYKTIQASDYATGVEVTPASKVVTLSTCTNVQEDDRFVVHAVAVEKQAEAVQQ